MPYVQSSTHLLQGLREIPLLAQLRSLPLGTPLGSHMYVKKAYFTSTCKGYAFNYSSELRVSVSDSLL